jgi:hypothetical protein
MISAAYINLPVADLERARTFFSRLGFTFDDRFSDDTALGMKISETIYSMLLTHKKFDGFMPPSRKRADAGKTAQVLIALQVENRKEVDRIADAAAAGGAGKVRDPADHGFMYERSFSDPDGHIWEIFHMDMASFKQASAANAKE